MFHNKEFYDKAGICAFGWKALQGNNKRRMCSFVDSTNVVPSTHRSQSSGRASNRWQRDPPIPDSTTFVLWCVELWTKKKMQLWAWIDLLHVTFDLPAGMITITTLQFRRSFNTNWGPTAQTIESGSYAGRLQRFAHPQGLQDSLFRFLAQKCPLLLFFECIGSWGTVVEAFNPPPPHPTPREVEFVTGKKHWQIPQRSLKEKNCVRSCSHAAFYLRSIIDQVINLWL